MPNTPSIYDHSFIAHALASAAAIGSDTSTGVITKTLALDGIATIGAAVAVASANDPALPLAATTTNASASGGNVTAFEGFDFNLSSNNTAVAASIDFASSLSTGTFSDWF